MSIGSVFFFVLFGFLIFLFSIFIVSLIKKDQKKSGFEPAVTVVIPVYNEEDHIAATLDSILAEDYPKDKIEVIVVDDGSKDKTVEIVKKYKAVRLIKQDHKGKVHALNTGAKAARHEFILTVDADTSFNPEFIREMVGPFSDKMVAATSGAVRVKNTHTFSGIFQNIEYHQNNLIRRSFSKVFNTGIWFFGCLACYRASILEQLGGFKKDTMAEDMDIAMECKSKGYKTINVSHAIAYTNVPTNHKDLFEQRSRWWIGGLQSLRKNKKLFSLKSDPSVLFLFINHYWWAFYAFLSLPFFIYQINYWFPAGTEPLSVFMYFFRWLSLAGPVYVLYKIPEWGLNIYNIFGVMSGIIATAMLVSAIKVYKDRLSLKNILAIFFYFPYTIFLNILLAGSVIRTLNLKKDEYFIRK